MTNLSIGMFGCGTVGGGVYNLIQQRQEEFTAAGLSIQIRKICVRNVSKARPDLALNPAETTFVTRFQDILDDPSINCIIELIGGVGDAKDIVFRAIEQDKSVITANKALVAHFMTPLTALLAQHPLVNLGLEAAVCGGIPIIHLMQDASGLVDNINTVMGIMNGTTNFMLSKMDQQGVGYAEVLQEAQALGFAEADPSADVDGLDVQSKIAILAKLAFGGTIDCGRIPTTGIRRITQADFEYAKMMKSTIKLLGVAHKQDKEQISVYVSPVMVPQANVMASVHGATNIVNILSANCQSSAYVGQGAGRYPTANSVLSDIVQIARQLAPAAPFPADQPRVTLQQDYSARFYVRIKIRDGVGIIKVIGGLAEQADVSIHSILQAPIEDPENVDFVVTTEVTHLSRVQSMCREITKQTFVLEEPLHFPILDN